MPHTYHDITLNEILHANFKDEGWPQLIGKLLCLEASVNGIPIDCLSLCYKTKKDGGIDLLAYDIDTSSEHINKPATIYACKAYRYTKGEIDKDLRPFSSKAPKFNLDKIKEGNWGLKQQFKGLMENGAHLTWVIKESVVHINSEDIKQETVSVIKKYYNIDVPSCRIHVYNAEKIWVWVNDQTKSSTMNTLARQYVRAFLGNPEPITVVHLWQWLKDPKYTNEFNDIYYYDEHFERLKVRAIESLFGGAPNLFMLVSGLSGLGKTSLIRWILTEYLSTLEEDQRNMVEARTIYYDWAYEDKSLVNRLIIMKDMIVIFDNCTIEIAQELYTRRSGIACKLVLITSDLETRKSLKHDVEHIFLNPDDCGGVVNKYLETQSLKPDNKEIIKKYSHGFVYYAIHMAQELVRGGEDSNILCVAQDISERIIGKVFRTGDYSDEQLYLPVLRACALFSEFGWDVNGDYHRDLSWIVENLVHFQITVPNKENVIFNVCRIGYEQKIFEKRGSYLSLRPMPLAYMLVSKYLINLTSNEKKALISSADNTQLAESMARQFAHFNHMPESILVVEGILESLYADFSLRNSIFERNGARVFLALLNVHPEKCLDILKGCYQHLSFDEVKSQKETRSYTVSALRKLVFSKLYFQEAIEILYRLAQVETEDWSNNATESLTQLFQLLLPGTEVSLTVRMRIVQKWYQESDDTTLPIILKILKRSIKTNHFVRHGGNERFGSGPSFDEYHRIDWGEVSSYIRNSIVILKTIIETQPLFRIDATNIVVNAIENLVYGGMWSIFKEVFPYDFWQEDSLKGIQDQLSKAIHFKRAEDDVLQSVEEYRNRLFNDPIKQKFIDIVISPNHATFDESLIEQGLDEFVKELMQQKVEVRQYIDLLLDGFPREGYRFGKVIALNNYQIMDIANAFLDRAKIHNEVNFGFFNSLSRGMSTEDKALMYSRLVTEPELQPYSFAILSSTSASIEDILYLFSLVNIVKGGVANFVHFAYGRALEHLNVSCRIELVNCLLEYSTVGKQVALEIIHMDVFSNRDTFESYHSILDDLLFDPCLFDQSELNRDISYGWGELMLYLLQHHQSNSSRVAQYITDLYRQKHDNSSLTSEFQKIFNALSSNHFDDFWQHFSSLLMDDNNILRMRLKFDFGWINGSNITNPVLKSSSNSTIFNWCIENGEKAAARVIGIIKLYGLVDEIAVWDDLALSLIKQYNSSNMFLSSLYVNLGTYSTYGSGVNMAKQMIALYNSLLEVDEIVDKTWVRGQIAAYGKQAEYLQQRHEEMFIGYDR